jgi:hypothetical protein
MPWPVLVGLEFFVGFREGKESWVLRLLTVLAAVPVYAIAGYAALVLVSRTLTVPVHYGFVVLDMLPALFGTIISIPVAALVWSKLKSGRPAIAGGILRAALALGVFSATGPLVNDCGLALVGTPTFYCPRPR